MAEVTESIVQMAAHACIRHGDYGEFLCLGARLGFRDLGQLSTDFAGWLAWLGLQSGDRVAVQLPNLLQYPVIALGVLKAGLVLVNVNPLYTTPELAHQLRDSGARLLVIEADGFPVAAEAMAGTGVSTIVVTRSGDMHTSLGRALSSCSARRLTGSGLPRYTSLRAALRLGRRAAARDPGMLARRAPGPDALAVLQYTGGTTGPARAAMLSHRNLLANVRQLAAALGERRPEEGMLMVAPLPLYHVYAFTMSLLSGIAWGLRVLLIPEPRDTTAMVKTLKEHRINALTGVNTLYKSLCDHPGLSGCDFSGLRLCSAGGMPLASAVAARWLELTGCAILEGYGLSECSPLVACNSYVSLRAGTVGQPVPGTEVVLKAADGTAPEDGEPGEICVRGPQVMQGYWQQPQQTAAAFTRDGYLRTGDIGVFDAEGNLRVVDRIKDMLIVSGLKVYPHEIEDHVRRHPDIEDAAVVDCGDDCAPCVSLFVVTRNPQLEAETLIAWCREGLAPYKVPKRVEFRRTLPRTNMGKVLRRELRNAARAVDKANA